MLDFILAPGNLPFGVALALMIMIGLVEAVGFGVGALDLDADLETPGGTAGLLAWLGVGRVPLLALLVVFLAWFAMGGLAVQQAAASLLGASLSPLLASAAAAVAALPLTGFSANALARVLPRDESTAVALDTLVGKRATIQVGVASRGSPAKGRVRDVHGQSHYVMVEPSLDEQRIGEGETVLLVRREGDLFIGLWEGEALYAPLQDRPAPIR